MASDALSDWIVEQKDTFEQAIDTLLRCKNHKEYDTLINELRLGKQRPKLKDDDTTFIAIEISEADSREITMEFSYAESFENLIKNESVLELKKKTEQYEEAQGEISRLEISIRRGEKALKSLENEKSALEASLEQERKEHSALKTQYSKISNEKDALESQLNTAKSAGEQRKRDILSLEKEKAKLEEEVRQYKKREKSLNQQIIDLKNPVQSPRPMGSTTPCRAGHTEMDSLQTQLNTEIAEKSAVLKQIEEIKSLLGQIRQAYDASQCRLTNYDALLTLLNLFSSESQIIEVTFIEKQKFGQSTGDGGFQLG